MSVFLAVANFLREKEARKSENFKRRRLRDHSNPLDFADSTFISYYRLNKEAFRYVFQEIKPLMNETSVPLALQLGATLRFLAEGGYQRAVGMDSIIFLERSSVRKILKTVLNVMEIVLCARWIQLRMTPEEKNRCKKHFSTKFRIPGVVSCVDGTHVKLTKPSESAHLYINRKGCFSINAMGYVMRG